MDESLHKPQQKQQNLKIQIESSRVESSPVQSSPVQTTQIKSNQIKFLHSVISKLLC